MRSDLNKQLCERERLSHSSKYGEVRKSKKYNLFGEEGEFLPNKESMKYRYGYNTKDFNENLNPLYKQIHKAFKEKKTWAEFYSDICKNFDKRSVINQHILTHLYDKISKNISLKDGELWVNYAYGGPMPLRMDSFLEYYVDPINDLIKKNPYYKSYKVKDKEYKEKELKEEALKTRWINEKTVLRKINGIWYIFDYLPMPKYEKVLVPRYVQKWYNIIRNGEEVPLMWKELTKKEKELYGVWTHRRNFVNDLYKHENSYIGKVDASHLKKDHYHASKKTVSHDLLKRLGLISN